jgi:glycosyltransferase involved in cell wall biosynthesis
MGDGSVHGVTRCLALWVPRYDPTRFQASVCNIRGRDPGVDHLEALGVPVAQLGRGRLDARAIGDLRTLVRRDGVHLLHLHGYGATNFGRIVGRMLGIPAVVHEHFIDPRVPPYQRAADRLLAGLTSWGFAVSEAVRAFMVAQRSMPAARLEVVPNGAPLDPFAQAARRGSDEAAAVRRSLGVPVDEPVVAIVGRLAPIKDHDLFLRAAALVVSRIPRVSFVIVGEGVAAAAEEQCLPTEGDVEITWLYRGATEPGTSERLLEAVRRVAFPEGAIYAWGGGEMDLMSAYGKHLRRERGLKTASISAIGHWRREEH